MPQTMDTKKKLREIASRTLGGVAEEYEVAGERVFHPGSGAGMSFAEAAVQAARARLALP